MKRKRRIEIFGSLLTALFLTVIMVNILGNLLHVDVRRTEGGLSADTIVIDAGHGGFDGGAQGRSGVPEKNINLSIALELKDLAEHDGWTVVMTRTEDVGLQETEEGKRAIRSLKTEDLKNRKAIIDRVKPCVAISIHLNSFKQDSSVHGAQTFYPVRAESEEILDKSKKMAELIQENLVRGMEDGTNRVALGKRDVLLLKNPMAPTVIVECGFLSNETDENNLQNENYQKKLANFIYAGILEYSGKKPREPLKLVKSCSAGIFLN